MAREIVLKECISVGKKSGKNDDDIYVGKDFAAVIDGVSNKSLIKSGNKEIKIAQIITEAIRAIDGTITPKKVDFHQFVRYINLYIAKYLKEHGIPEKIGELEATGVIYSKFHNQIWLIGDCRAIHDGHVVENPLKIDDIYSVIRSKIINALLEAGYSVGLLQEDDKAKDIIKNPKLLETYIKDADKRKEVEEYWKYIIKQTLLGCGFSEEKIERDGLVEKYYNPRTLQVELRNNSKMGDYGYAIFNGKDTETKKCIVEQLPDDVKTIKLFSDGFSIDALNNNRDIGYAYRKEQKKANEDVLSIGENMSTRAAVKYGVGAKEKSIDDASAIIIEIKQIEKEKDEDEGR